MATNVDKKIDAKVDTEGGRGTTPPTDKQNDTSHTGSGQNGISRRTWLLDLNRLLLHLACLVYSLYLIWLLAHLKGNNYYWFLSFIPFVFNFWPVFLFCIAYRDYDHIQKGLPSPSYGLVLNLMACFTMLTRQAYYHRQPDQFIGPRFIIISMQGSIVFILLDFVLQREGKQESVLDYKDALTRMLLDFVDIFNMVEILSVNVCVGVGWHVSEDSSTEMAIQAFCTMSFLIVLFFSQYSMIDEEEQHSPRTSGEILYSKLTLFSGLYQNVPFLIIRICVWAQYKLYNLGFLVKNVTVIIFFTAVLGKKLLIACGCIKTQARD